MIPQIKKILYATDLSKNSSYAFLFATDMARRHDAKIAFYGQGDLERRTATLATRRDPLSIPIDAKIVERDYQRECIETASIDSHCFSQPEFLQNLA